MRAIAAQGLRRRFGGLVAVDHVDLTIKKGELFGLLGPNGAEKQPSPSQYGLICHPRVFSLAMIVLGDTSLIR